jgi:type II secretory pathway pseudopilin PulG
MVLAAFLYPVFQSAKRSAKIVDTMSNAHQIWVALTLYRTDWDGNGRTGTGSEMGLPVTGKQLFDAVPTSLLMKTCSLSRGFDYWPNNDAGKGSWMEAVTLADESVPLVSTDTCTEPQWDTKNQFHPKLGIASTLSGTILRKRKNSGSTFTISFWIN